jgi:hypothetical protein
VHPPVSLRCVCPAVQCGAAESLCFVGTKSGLHATYIASSVAVLRLSSVVFEEHATLQHENCAFQHVIQSGKLHDLMQEYMCVSSR